jgi:alpha-1,6-mannosyltransferase
MEQTPMDRVVATRKTPVPRLSVHRWSPRAVGVAAGELQRTGMLPGLAVGVAGAGLIAVGGVLVGPEARPYGPGATIAGYVASYLGLLLLVGAWLHIGRILRRQPGVADAGVVVVVLLAWCVPLLVGPPLFSRDIFSYAAHGREIVRGVNPYHHGPAALGGGPYLRFVSGTWSTAPSPYGPLFVAIDGMLVRPAGDHAMQAVAALRLLSFGGVILLAVWLPRLSRACGTDASLAVWLGVMNPLVLLHVVSGGHNDGLMLGLLVAGLTLARRTRFGPALLLCVLAATIKAPAALGVVYVAADWLRSCPDRRKMAWTALKAAAIVAATTTLLSVPTRLGWGWLGTVTTPVRVRSLLSPMTDTGLAAGKVAHRLGVVPSDAWTVTGARIVGMAAAALICTVALAARHRWGSIRGLGISLLAVVALGPVIQPWYVLWGTTMVAAAGPRRLRPLLVWVSAGLAFLVLPNGGGASDVVTLGFLATVAAAAVMSTRESAERRERLVVP